MDIKEIALTDEAAQKVFKNEHCNISADLAGILARAIIESYKAELLKEAGEPVAKVVSSGAFEVPCLRWTSENASLETLIGTELFTSDQVAAAILKATKPLEEEIDRLNTLMLERNQEYFQQLKGAQEEIERPPAIDAYETYMAEDKESDPVERLRFFLSLALKGKDWFDVERFIKDVSDQLAAAQEEIQKLRLDLLTSYGESDELSGQLAKAEQRVAEACALQVATETKFHWLDAARVAKEIRSGEWRKFVKEV